ncbi:MAG: BMC domain-containing protein [Ignavibacteriaceae bacterium]|jgi:ethanolamine utilization protein EutM|nr:BMC domain-containing protein [Ignavibacteriaceae bacterium]
MADVTENIFGDSLGFVETKSFIGAIEASDAMVKAAKVKLLNHFRIGGALVTVVVKGDLASCIAAVDAGKDAAMRTGELISSNVIARPFEDTNHLVNFFISDKVIEKPDKKERRKKNVKRKKTVSKKTNPEEDILSLIKSSQGLTIDLLSEKIGIDKVELRQLLKKMIDNNQIEKAGNKYFIKK